MSRPLDELFVKQHESTRIALEQMADAIKLQCQLTTGLVERVFALENEVARLHLALVTARKRQAAENKKKV